jgi:GT2 family glycosyltransferase
VRTTIVLQSWDEAHLLERSLPAALAQPEADVLVLDNASSDGTDRLAERHGARVLRVEPRRSYAAATNEGIRNATGEAVLVLGADCFLSPGYLAAALPRLAEHGVGSVAGKLVRTLDGERHLDALDAAGMTVDRRRKNGLVGHGRPALAYDRPGEAFGPDGAAALYRRETLADCAIDGRVLDEDMARWASDADLAWRARLLGWSCAYEPAALAWHVRSYSPTTRDSMPAADRRMQFRNRYLMMLKNDTAGALARDLPRVAAYEALALAHALLRERTLLAGYGEAARLAPRALRARRALQARRRARGAPHAPLGLEAPA